MSKVKKVLIWVGVSFIAFCVLSVVVATIFPVDKRPKPKKPVKVQVEKPKPKAVKKVEKPKTKVEKTEKKGSVLKPTPEEWKQVKDALKGKKKVQKPKSVAKKRVIPEYTAEQVYRFALEYEVRQGQSVADILALGVIAMKGSGHTVEVVERQAQEYSIKGLWVVSCVVVVDGFERTQLRWEADMRNKTVRPLNKVARDLWGY